MPSAVRKFAAIALSIYLGTTIFIVGIAAFGTLSAYSTIGNGLLWIGLAGIIIGFVFMASTTGDMWSGTSRSLRMRSDDEFKRWRSTERPLDVAAWAIIAGSTLLSVTGYAVLVLSSP